MAVSVIPAYRVVSHFARQSADLPEMEAVDAIEGRMREYVRNLLSMLHPSFVELGQRSAVTDRKSTRPNSSHVVILYAVFCLKKNTFHPL